MKLIYEQTVYTIVFSISSSLAVGIPLDIDGYTNNLVIFFNVI